MKTMMRNAIFLLICCVFICSLVGCGGGSGDRGMQAEDAGAVFAEFADRYVADGDYMQLCATGLKESTVNTAMELFVAGGGHYFLTADGGALYEELQGKAPAQKGNEQVLGLYVNEDGQAFTAFKAQGYVVVAQDGASGVYTIVDIMLQET